MELVATIGAAAASINNAWGIIDKLGAHLDKIKDRAILKDLADLHRELTKIQREHAKLEKEISRLEKENEKLSQNITLAKNISKDDDSLAKEQTEILIYLFGLEDGREVTFNELRQQTKLQDQVLKYHTEVLQNRNFVYCYAPIDMGFGPSTPPRYSIEQSGREYIIKNNLI